MRSRSTQTRRSWQTVDPGTYDPPALRDVTINSIRDGTDEWDFSRFEQDPYEALLLHHLNRGITQFNFSDEDELIEDIRSEALTEDEVEEIRTSFRATDTSSGGQHVPYAVFVILTVGITASSYGAGHKCVVH